MAQQTQFDALVAALQQGIAAQGHTSYLRGSALQFSRNYVKERCGFRVWQSLLWEFQPSTKQRSLTLSQAIAMYPGFDDVKPMVEQIGALENLVRDYELSAGKTYDRDLLMGPWEFYYVVRPRQSESTLQSVCQAQQTMGQRSKLF